MNKRHVFVIEMNTLFVFTVSHSESSAVDQIICSPCICLDMLFLSFITVLQPAVAWMDISTWCNFTVDFNRSPKYRVHSQSC